MKMLLLAAILFPAATLAAQTTGTAHPEALNDTIESTPDTAPHYVKPSAKPSPAVPAETTPAALDAMPALQPRPFADHATAEHSRTFNAADPDSGVVIDVPNGPNDLSIGTRIVAQLNNTISTKLTPAGTPFAAELTQPVLKDGRVLLPAGSVIEGRITQIHGGRRISGASAIRLQPQRIILPDSTRYRLYAEVVDLDHVSSSKVNREGVITDKTNGKLALGAAGVTTTAGAVTGAMIGGGVGAVVGAGIGAGIGTYWWLRQDRQQTLPTGTEIVFSLDDILRVHPTEAPQTASASSF